MDTLSILIMIFSAARLEALNDIDCQDLGATHRLNNKCYRILDESVSWDTAQDYCATYLYHGILAELVNDGEIGEVITFVKNYPSLTANSDVWLGARANTSTQLLVWKNSEVILFGNETGWKDPHKPNYFVDYNNCIRAEGSQRLLNGAKCYKENVPLCQTEIKQNCSEILPGALFASDYCFKYYKINSTWEDAKSYCLQNNSHLAEPTTPDMIRTLTIYLRNVINVWIGATDVNRTNRFYWETSGEPVNSEYMNLTDGLGQDRHLLWYNAQPYKVNWTDRPGNEEYGFVCQTAYLKRNASQYLAIIPKKHFNSDTKMYLNLSTANEFVVYVTIQLLDVWTNQALNNRILTLSNQRAIRYELNFAISHSDASSYFVTMKSTAPLVIGCDVEGQAQRFRCSTKPLPSELSNATNDILLISVVPVPPETTTTDFTTDFTTVQHLNTTPSITTDNMDDTTVLPLNTSPSKTTENISKAEMDSMIHELQDQIKKELLVQYRNVSMFRRAKTTAEDKRTSSEVIGSVIGIGTIVFVFFLICIADVVACGYFLFNLLKNKCFPFKEERP